MIDSVEIRSVQGMIHTLRMLKEARDQGDKGELRMSGRDDQDTWRQRLSP